MTKAMAASFRTQSMASRREPHALPHVSVPRGPLPHGLRQEIDRLSKFRYFKEELSKFLDDNKLPAMTVNRPDGWAHFFHLYTKIIEDCPLVMSAKNATATIDSVTVRFEFAKEPVHGEMLYKIRWIVQDKNGLTGEIYIINSFSVNSED
jgi:hypothetical protein